MDTSVDVVGKGGDVATVWRKRRSWTQDEKRRIVDDSIAGDDRVGGKAEEFGLGLGGQTEIVLAEGDRIIVVLKTLAQR